MEGFALLLGLAVITCVFVLPIAAFVRAGSSRQDIERLEASVAELWVQVSRLRDLLESSRGQSTRTVTPSAETEIAPSPGPVAAAPPSTATRPEPAPPVVPEAPRRRAPVFVAPFELPPVLAKQGLEAEEPPKLEPEPAGETQPASSSPPPLRPLAPAFDWERFMGAKLFAWLGGLALFLAVAYLVKYSFENNLIPPEVRVGFGFLLGIGLVVSGVLWQRKAYVVTSHTLCATGVVILYAVTFSCRAVYHFAFFGPTATFLFMTLITATAFLLAVRMDAMVVAILGMVGGFLTPVLLSTGVDNPVGLFTYIALLDAGLIAVALVRPWPYLVALAATGTVLMELGWSARFFAPEKLVTAVVVFLGFNLVFLGGWELSRRRGRVDKWWYGTAASVALSTLLYAVGYLTIPGLVDRPGWIGLLVLGADLCLLFVVVRHPVMARLQWAGGALAYSFVAIWAGQFLTESRLFWVLGWVFVFALLHSVFPVIWARREPKAAEVGWAHLFPPAALVLLLLPLLKLTTVSILIWPVILLIDLLAIGLAVMTASLLSILAVLGITVLLAGTWILRIPAEPTGLPFLLVVIAAISVVFLLASWLAIGRVTGRLKGRWVPNWLAAPGETASAELMVQLPVLSALLPFLLLILISLRLPLPNPSLVFALALALAVLLLSVTRTFSQPLLAVVSLVCVLLLEAVWQLHQFNPLESAGIPLAWHLGFASLFLAFPFVSRRQCEDTPWPWATAALSLPVHFPLVYRLVKLAWPNDVMGLLPAAGAVPLLGLLAVVGKWFPEGHPRRNGVLAWFGGAGLFFVTLIFPIQFDRQWITLAWALEGAALCWLFHRVPHPGLRWTGVGLLILAFARLALNPAVLTYHPRSNTPLLNWYLYTYGTVTVTLFVAARLLAPPRDRLGGASAPGLLYTLGTVLAFLLLNLEVADYFTKQGEAALTFQFSGNFARDMSYTIAWALFALVLLVAGLRRRLPAARYGGLGLMSVTFLKLFFHDLSQLDQRYRIGALAAVAVIAILASFLYQKFLAAPGKAGCPPSPPPS